MAHENHEQAIKGVYVGLAILAVITLIEVGVSLFGKGHIIDGVQDNYWVVAITALLIIALSLYKAKFIIFEFMHMKHEVPGLAKTVLLPTVLLVWGMIAFFHEGNAWKNSKSQYQTKNKISNNSSDQQQGMLNYEWSKEDFQ